MAVGQVWTCTEWDSATDACSVEGWADAPSAMPTLSAADGAQIGFAIALLWASAFVLRQLRKMLDL